MLSTLDSGIDIDPGINIATSCLQNHDSCSLNEVIYHKMTFIKVNTNFGSTQSKGKKLCQIKYFNKDLAPIKRIPLFSYVE